MSAAARRAPLAVAAAWGLGLVTAVAYWSRDTVPPRWDAAGHLLRCLEYADILRTGRVIGFLWTHYAYYPPLVYQITGALHLLLGPGPWVAWAVMQAFALALGLATWRLARVIGGPSMAALPAVAVLLTPIVVVFTREFALDVPLMAASTALLALVLDDPLRTRRRALALGAVIGLGLLVKWTFALAALGPLVYLAIAAARGRLSRRHWIAAASGALVAVPWYAWNLQRLWVDARFNAVVMAAREGDPPLASPRSLAFYAAMALDEWFFLPLAALVAWGMVAAVRERGRALLLLNVAVWPAYALFTLIPNKDARYALPLIPPLCVVAARTIASLPGAWRAAAAALPIALLALQHLAGVLDLGPLSARTNLCLPGPALHVYDPADPPLYFSSRSTLGDLRDCTEWTLYNPFSYFGHRPRREDWQIDAIVTAIPDGAAVQPMAADDVHLSPSLLAYVARRKGRPIRWAEPADAAVRVSRETAPPGAPLSECQRFDQPDGTRVAVCAR